MHVFGPARRSPSSFPSVRVIALLAVAAACEPGDPTADRTPPRVLAIEPSDPVVAVDTAFRVTFSENLDPDTVEADPTSEKLSVVLIPRSLASEAFVNDMENAGLAESRQDDVIPIDVDVRGEFLDVTPSAPLEPLTAFTLLISPDVRDQAQNPVVDAVGLAAVYRYDFSTDAGPPAVLTTDVAGAALVAPNRRRITVTFNQPVRDVTNESLFLSPAVAVEAILLDESRTVATLFIGDGAGCARLTPSTTYTLTATSAIRGDTGQGLVPFSTEFTTGAACDTTPNLLVDGPDAIAGEVAATIRFETNKPSTTEVRFGVVGTALDCLGNPCPVVGGAARQAVPGSSPPRFLHTVEVAGLIVDQTYEVIVTAEDDVGFTATASLTFVTAPLPKISLNEVMANPSLSPETQGEYVELANFGPDVVDVSGWAILVEGGDESGGCTAVLPEGLAVGAGGFLVVAGKDFNADAYALTPDVPVARLVDGDANAMCALVNSRAQALVLVDGDGRPVSSISSYASIIPDNDGRSVERTAPEAADVETSFCFARASVQATPGRANSVTVGGCE